MSIEVYAWPPVGVIGTQWTEQRPVARLRSMLTGRDQMQASQRKRRLATIQVSALGRGSNGAGYCEMLIELLQGGIHAVRLRSEPINWHRHFAKSCADFNSQPLAWRTGANPLAWRAGSTVNPLLWFSGRVVIGGAPAISGGWDVLPLSGLPPSTLVARPGDFIRVYEFDDASIYEIARVLAPCTSAADGTATLRLNRAVTISGGRVNLAGQDEGVFRVEGGLPRAVQPVSGDWSYSWSFCEVFADEVGGFVERDPWT